MVMTVIMADFTRAQRSEVSARDTEVSRGFKNAGPAAPLYFVVRESRDRPSFGFEHEVMVVMMVWRHQSNNTAQ